MKIFWSKKALIRNNMVNKFEGFAMGVDALAKEIVDYAWKNESLGMVVELLTKGNNKIYQAIRSAIYNYEPAKGSALYNLALRGKPASTMFRNGIADILRAPSRMLGCIPIRITTAGTTPDFTVKYQVSNDLKNWRDVGDNVSGKVIPERFIRTLMEGNHVVGSPRIIPTVRRDVRPGEQLKFKVKIEDKDYQVRIFVNDPVTVCQVKRDGEWQVEGSTIRSPKDKWSGKVAVTKALYDAAYVMAFDPENGEDKAIIKEYFDALFKKYPELKGSHGRSF